jgi:hypothetical protein
VVVGAGVVSSPGDGGEKRVENSVSFPSSCDFFGQTRRRAILRISRVLPTHQQSAHVDQSHCFFARFRVLISRLATRLRRRARDLRGGGCRLAIRGDVARCATVSNTSGVAPGRGATRRGRRPHTRGRSRTACVSVRKNSDRPVPARDGDLKRRRGGHRPREAIDRDERRGGFGGRDAQTSPRRGGRGSVPVARDVRPPEAQRDGSRA